MSFAPTFAIFGHMDGAGGRVVFGRKSAALEIALAQIFAGAKGDTGPAGAAGKNGTDGKDGKDGAKGDTGPAGAAGKNGTDGKDGKDGAKGDTGPAGAAGKDGTNGKDGQFQQMLTPDHQSHDVTHFYFGWQSYAGGWLVRRQVRASGASSDAKPAQNTHYTSFTSAWAASAQLTYGET